MTVYESDLPGVGKKFEIELDEDDRLVVVTHNTGKREVFRRRGDEDSEKLFELSDRLARQVGTVLEGAYFQPVATETTEMMLGEDTLFEWVRVVEGSTLVGRTLADLDFRASTGASVVAIQREGDTVSAPGADTAIRADDTLVVIGPREACDRVERLAAGADADDEVTVSDEPGTAGGEASDDENGEHEDDA